MRQFFYFLLGCWMCGGVWAQTSAHASAPRATPSFAFYYGADVPWESLGAFDYAVVEPGNVKMLGPVRAPKPGWAHRLNPGTQVVAYISVGEVHPTREYFKRMRPEWKLGENKAWDSIVVDQAAPGYAEFYLKEVIEPLWAQGYRAFFLDTLDSFYLVAKTPEAQAKQVAGMAQLIKAIKRAKPEAKLIFNRGFEILPQVHTEAFAVVAESLFQGYNAEKKEYREVPEADREWLWNQLKKCRDEYGLPVVSIDYVPPDQRELARQTAQKIRQLGAIAWVSNPELNMLGVGQVEVLPRQVLAIHDEEGDYDALATHSIHRQATVHLNYLGYDVRYAYHSGQELAKVAQETMAGRYAGVVLWFTDGRYPKSTALEQVLAQAKAQGVPVVFIGALPPEANLPMWGMQVGTMERTTTQLRLDKRSPHVGFEVEPKPIATTFLPILLEQGTSWLRVFSSTGLYADVVAITPWGGYALERYWQMQLTQDFGQRWVVDPVEFFRAALTTDPAQPMPDVTTEAGKRMLLVHHDGDGFANRAELPGAPLASEVMLKEFLQRYRVPTTVSVIEAEVSGQGLYAQLAPVMEATARAMFALPHVEIASHTYSHPFVWAEAQKGSAGKAYPGLQIPGYRFSVEREIVGSAQYINDRLAPAGKKTRMLLWSGDTRPLAEPVKVAYEHGLLNMNSGDTLITRGKASLSLISPIGMMKGDYFQVYAPNQNENVYTGNWTGPFYGYERVIETFEMTDKPRRIKPVNIYYHTYIASKRASIASLHKVYQWAMAQDLHPVFASSYAERVLDWRRATVARTATGGYEMRGGELLRQWRVAGGAGLSHTGCTGVAGSRLHEGLRYLNAINSIANCAVNSAANGQFGPQTAVLANLEASNARVTAWERSAGRVNAVFEGHVPLKARVQTTCSVDAAASSAGVRALPVGGGLEIESQSLGQTRVVFRCPE